MSWCERSFPATLPAELPKKSYGIAAASGSEQGDRTRETFGLPIGRRPAAFSSSSPLLSRSL
jgi:hypothetical protein